MGFVTTLKHAIAVGGVSASLLNPMIVEAADGQNSRYQQIALETTLGTVVIQMDRQQAPLTTAYFLEYVDRGQYDGATLYRAASLDGQSEPQIVQGGMMLGALTAATKVNPADYGVSYLQTVEATDKTGITHQRGTVSFARDLLYTGYVIPEIVFCLRDVPEMNADGRDKPDREGFPAAGKVISGMDVIEAVTRRALGGETTIPFLQGQVLTAPVEILKAYSLPAAGVSLSGH